MFDTPTNPMKPEVSVDKLLENMSGSGFQGRKLGESFQIWKEMIETPGIRIIIGLSGPMFMRFGRAATPCAPSTMPAMVSMRSLKPMIMSTL
jgi:hypothetical protein